MSDMTDRTMRPGETDVAPACDHLEVVDPAIFAAIQAEAARQHEGLELIAVQVDLEQFAERRSGWFECSSAEVAFTMSEFLWPWGHIG